MHRHVYRLAAQFSETGRGVCYQDWECIRENCTKVIRRHFVSPPDRRIDAHTTEPTEVREPRVFGASDA
jgi:hypothetical protein